MRVLFVNRHPFLPQIVGGVETSTLQLAKSLEASGHPAAVLTGLRSGDRLWFVNRLKRRLTGCHYPADRFQGVTVYRGYRPEDGLDKAIARFGPDALIVSGGSAGTVEFAIDCSRFGLPTFLYCHDVESFRALDTQPTVKKLHFLANSSYTARKLRELLDVPSVVLPPLVDPRLYRTTTSREYVAMINPRRVKGGDIALELAMQCPDIPFLFVEAWTGGDEFVTALQRSAAALPNVRWLPVSTKMRDVYSVTRLLLVPSRWEETWGRVVTEAHLSGIPVLSSSVAALPESVGPGGVLLDIAAPIEEWRTTLRKIWDDQSTYDTLAEAALRFSAREEVSPTFLAKRFLDYFASVTRPSVTA